MMPPVALTVIPRWRLETLSNNYFPYLSTAFFSSSNMFSSQILHSKLVGKIVKGGKKVAIAAATETRLRTRSDFVADERGPGFIKAVEQDPKPLPEGTAKVIMR